MTEPFAVGKGKELFRPYRPLQVGQDFAMLLICVMLALMGAGPLSLDARVRHRGGRTLFRNREIKRV